MQHRQLNTSRYKNAELLTVKPGRSYNYEFDLKG